MKKAICIALVVALIVLIFCGPLAQESKAFAASVVIVGAVIAVMAASGIALVATSGLTASELQNYIGNKLDEWASSLGQPLDHLINSAGIGMTISGLMTIATAASQGINNFVSWLVTDQQLQDNTDTTVIVPSAGIMKLTDQFQWVCQRADNGAGFQVKLDGGVDVYCVAVKDMSSGYFGPLIVSRQEAQVVLIYRDFHQDWQNPIEIHGASTSTYNSSASLYYTAGSWMPNAYSETAIFSVPVFGDIQSGLDYVNDKLNAGSLSGSGGLTVRTGTIAIPTVGTTDKYFIDVTGVLPGDTADIAAQRVVTNVVTGVRPIEKSEVATEEPPYVVTGPVEIPGLAQVFPFCLPFDVYNFLSALAADPEAPHFTWRFYVPGICDETLEIDLSGFNTVAQILRTMELLAFIVGLAFVTRSRFIRS